MSGAFSAKAAVGSRPPTQDKQKTGKRRCSLFAVNSKEENALLFSVFLFASFEAVGHRPQPQGLRTSKSREALMLGVKTGGVALGIQTKQAVFMVFVKSLRLIWREGEIL